MQQIQLPTALTDWPRRKIVVVVVVAALIAGLALVATSSSSDHRRPASTTASAPITPETALDEVEGALDAMFPRKVAIAEREVALEDADGGIVVVRAALVRIEGQRVTVLGDTHITGQRVEGSPLLVEPTEDPEIWRLVGHLELDVPGHGRMTFEPVMLQGVRVFAEDGRFHLVVELDGKEVVVRDVDAVSLLGGQVYAR